MVYTDSDLLEWAFKYFGSIPNPYKLPSDKRLENTLWDGITEANRKDLSWIRTLIEGDITSIARKKNKDVHKPHQDSLLGEEDGSTNDDTLFG